MSSNPGDELVDVVDDDGKVIGTATRREVRARRLAHRCVYVLVFNRHGELFIHLRTPTKDVFPSHWDIAAGGVLAAGESFDQGAQRESEEELGVVLELEPLFPFRHLAQDIVEHAMVYRALHDGPFRLQPEEIVCGEFVSLEEVAVRAGMVPFCPDGLAVLAEFRRHQSRLESSSGQ
jgi:isopentenyldiphosphate isomerase